MWLDHLFSVTQRKSWRSQDWRLDTQNPVLSCTDIASTFMTFLLQPAAAPSLHRLYLLTHPGLYLFTSIDSPETDQFLSLHRLSLVVSGLYRVSLYSLEQCRCAAPLSQSAVPARLPDIHNTSLSISCSSLEQHDQVTGKRGGHLPPVHLANTHVAPAQKLRDSVIGFKAWGRAGYKGDIILDLYMVKNHQDGYPYLNL